MVSLKILVTGGAGFIGSHLVTRLLQAGYSVRIIDNLSTGKLENMASFLNAVEFIVGDIRDFKFIKKNLDGIDVVIHLAAIVSVPFAEKYPDLTFETNVGGTLNLLRACSEQGVGKLIFASSCAVYGDATAKPIFENSKVNPISTYALSKLIAERCCLGFYQRNLLKTIVLRFFNVYGPRQGLNEYSGVITQFINKINLNSHLVIYGDGSQTRDFVYISDIVDAILASLRHDIAVGETFNIGSGNPTTIKQLAQAIIEISGVDVGIQHQAPRIGDIKESYAEILKASTLLCFKPKVTLSAGLQALLSTP